MGSINQHGLIDTDSSSRIAHHGSINTDCCCITILLLFVVVFSLLQCCNQNLRAKIARQQGSAIDRLIVHCRYVVSLLLLQSASTDQPTKLLSSIAPAVAADRSIAVIAAIVIHPAEHENYDKSIDADRFFAPTIDRRC